MAPSGSRTDRVGVRRGMALLVVLAILQTATQRSPAAPPPRRPNVVVILADDLGFSDPGRYGGEIDTPALDRLAADGLRFTQGYNTARCWPTRAALLTGFYPQAIRRDALPGGQGGTGGQRPAWAVLLPQRLAAAGYRSYHSGKWHIDGDPRQAGFARSLDVNATGQNNYFDVRGITVEGRGVAGGADFYTTTAIGDHAVECLVEHAREHADKPFFHYVAFTAPHFPLQAPADLVAKYRDRYRVGWDVARDTRVARVAAEGIVTTPAAAIEREVGPPYPFPKALDVLGPGEVDRPRPWEALAPPQREFQADKMAIHAAMVEALDREVGRIVAQLGAMKVRDDTLVMFLSDNGASAEIMVRGEGHDQAAPAGSRKTFLCLGPGWSSCANAPFRRHKTWVHEGGIATPWIVHWPAGIAAKGELRRQPVHVIDVVPTVLGLVGLEPAADDPPLQGRSFAAALTDATAAAPERSLWWCHEGHRAVRVGDWKLVAAKGRPWELYDLAADRCETVDLAARQPERVADLDRAWTRVADECRTLAATPARRPPAARPAAAPPAVGTRHLAGTRPNVILVITDDQGYGDLGAHGNRVIRTPRLDRLHAESVRLTEFHVSPTCAPTRAALLTGRHEFRSGVTHTILERERLAPTAVTLPQLLAKAGYTCGIFGKWHLGDEDAYQPGRRGFDRVFIHGAGGIGQTYSGSCGDVPGNTYFDPVIRSDGSFVRTEGYCSDVFFTAALDWIDRCRRDGRPFFCQLATNAPHDPLDCPPGSDTGYLGPLASAGVGDAGRRAKIAKFYGMIENIDTNLGRLLDALDRWGIAERTLVVFMTDNGTATGAAVADAGMRGQKGSPYRGGTRVPSLWRWPGMLPAGVDVPAVTAHIDVLPTLCALTGATIPGPLAGTIEGRSLVPLLEDPTAAWPDRPLITHVGRWERGQAAKSAHRNCRVREGRWQLVNTANRPDAWELYDVIADPGERRDVATEHPDVVARLAAGYDAWWADVQKDLVNEERDGPAENPFKTAFWRQFGRGSSAAPAAVLEPAAAAERKPNIVFFLCDDLGSGDLGVTGSRHIETPAIDALFARGTRLSRHWSGSAVCAPSRCVLLTGRHPGHAVVRSNREVQPEGQFAMPAGTVTLAGILRDAGYATGAFGKWGLGPPGGTSDPLACGFDRFFGYNCQREAHSFYPGHLWSDRQRVTIDNPSLAGDAAVARGGKVPPGRDRDDTAFAAFVGRRYSADLIADEQIAFIRANAARPFFLYVPTTVPHLALQVPADEPSLARYERHFGDERPYLGGAGYVPCRRPLATYAAMITRLDREVGRIVSTLEELGLTDDTIFVFSSDNGATRPGTGGIDTRHLQSNGPLRDWKGSPYEGGLRVPTAIAWPGRIPAGRTLTTATGFEDWLPTLLDLAGLHERIPAEADGLSLAAALEGRDAPPAERLLYRELTAGQWQAVTDGRWKAIRRPAGRAAGAAGWTTELFDLDADPAEGTDVAARHPEVVARLEADMNREHVPHRAWPLPFADEASRRAAEAGGGPSPAAAAAAGPPGRRPNILFIIADDQSPFDLRVYDPGSRLETPVIDSLAARGVVLDAACHMGSFSGAVCTPSRHMIMTGRSLWHLPIGPERAVGLGPLGFQRHCPMDIEDQVLAAVFNRAGYDTMRTCKRGNSYEAANRRFTVRHDAVKRAGTAAGGSGWHADRVLEYLTAREASGDTDPFFIHLGFSHPHDTRDGTPELLAKYGATNHVDPNRPPPRHERQPPLPANWLPRHPFDDGHADVRDEVDVSGVWRRRDEATIRNEIGREFACSENIDVQIGRVLDRLRSAGELDHTWIFYTSDHGVAIGRHGLIGKQNLYDHTWRVPMIVAGPGVKRGSRAAGNVYLADLLATFCAVAGIEPPASDEGTSFLPVLTGAKPQIREVLYGAYCGGAKPGIRCVRRGDWKLVKYESPQGGVVTQLFDLRHNPQELLAEHHEAAVITATGHSPAVAQRNLAAEPAQAATRADLERLLVAEMRRLHDPYRFSDLPPEEPSR